MSALATGHYRASCLSPVVGAQSLEIGFTTGTRTIAEANELLTYIDSDYDNWGLNHRSEAKSVTALQLFETVGDMYFGKAFEHFDRNLRDLCLTQHQILEFIRFHHEWLIKTGRSTFFLMERWKNEFFVVGVFACRGGWGSHVHDFSSTRNYVWVGRSKRRIVVPRL